MSESKIASYLAEHPRMAGVLFTVLLLLSQTGTVAANGGCTQPGP